MRAADEHLTDQRVAYGYSLLFYMLVYDIYMAAGFVVEGQNLHLSSWSGERADQYIHYWPKF